MGRVAAITGGKKGVYHNKLALDCDKNGPLPIILTGPVLKSQNQNVPYTIYFREPDGTTDHYLNIENDRIADRFRQAPQGQVIYITPFGMSTEAADVKIEHGTPEPGSGGSYDDPQPPVHHREHQQQWPKQGQTATHAAPPPPREAPPPPPQENGIGPLRDEYIDCWRAGREVVRAMIAEHPQMGELSPETLAQWAKEVGSSLFIDRMRTHRPLR